MRAASSCWKEWFEKIRKNPCLKGQDLTKLKSTSKIRKGILSPMDCWPSIFMFIMSPYSKLIIAFG